MLPFDEKEDIAWSNALASEYPHASAASSSVAPSDLIRSALLILKFFMYALGVNVGAEVFKRILIRELNKLDDEDALSVAVIKEFIKGEEDEDDE